LPAILATRFESDMRAEPAMTLRKAA
jgi:hypothetical protein